MFVKVFSIGQVVYSKSGRDKGGVFAVVSVEGEYLRLADGDRRKLDKPKKKKAMHVQRTNYILENVRDKIANKQTLLDAEVRKSLKPYIEAREPEVSKEVDGLV